MKQYQTRSVPVQAWQYVRPEDPIPLWVARLVKVTEGYSGLRLEPRSDGLVSSRAARGDQSYISTYDWIVKDQDGAYHYDNVEFKRRYEEIPNATGSDE